MKRRGFLASILAAGFAPAAVGSGVLMPVRKLIVPRFTGRELWARLRFDLEMQHAYLRANPPLVVDPLGDVVKLLVQNNELLADPVWGRLR